MSQMTYGGIRPMSHSRYDIRPLLPHLPRRILRPMEQRSRTGLEVCLVCRQEFVSMEQVRCVDLERMGSQVEAFSQALELDLIGPDDFQSPSDAPA
jgi:hypothetical protein